MAETSGGSDNLIVKILGGAFATVIAPIAVALGLKYTDKAAPPADPAKPAAAATAAPDGQAAGKPDAAGKLASSVGSTTIPGRATPENRAGPQLVRLFNGVDKTGFYTWLGPTKRGEKPLGKNRDPDKVFTVKDGLLHIDGAASGGLVTEKEYENYELTVSYRWGERNWPPAEERARCGGILLHATGDDGAVRNHAMHSIRCDLWEGAAGTLRAVASNPKQPISFTVPADRRNVDLGKKQEIRYRYNPKAPLTTLTGGYVFQLGHDPDWKDVKGFRGRSSHEKPAGKWNQLECICDGGKITVRLNGTTVNEINDLTLHKGKIVIQALRSELFIREITLKPLTTVAAAKRP